MGDWLAYFSQDTATFVPDNWKLRVNGIPHRSLDPSAIRIKGDSEYGNDVRSDRRGMKMKPLLWRVLSVWLSVAVGFW